MVEKETKTEVKEEHIAKIRSFNLPISTKVATEIGSFIRYRPLKSARTVLNKVLEGKEAVPYKRYKRDIGHRPGAMAAGRYPVKAVAYFLNLLKALEINAENKGLAVDRLMVDFVTTNKAPGRWHFGRKRRRRFKGTHVEIRVKEVEEKGKLKEKAKEEKEKKSKPKEKETKAKKEPKETKKNKK